MSLNPGSGSRKSDVQWSAQDSVFPWLERLDLNCSWGKSYMNSQKSRNTFYHVRSTLCFIITLILYALNSGPAEDHSKFSIEMVNLKQMWVHSCSMNKISDQHMIQLFKSIIKWSNIGLTCRSKTFRCFKQVQSFDLSL